jgi:hypothetical protein
MSRRTDDTPIFKGYDDDGEPVFVWAPDVPQWMRDEYAEEWRRTHPVSTPSSDPAKEGGK